MLLKKSFIILFLLTYLQLELYAQLDNTPFEKEVKIDSSRAEKFTFNFRALGFNKNNEYYNVINEGQTYFGYRVIPSIGWQFQENFKIEGGIFLHHDFGNSQLRRVLPYFNFLYTFNDFELLFGNINGSIHHRQIEPMEDFERVMYDVPEQGIQIRRIRKNSFFDAWVNWETMIYQGSDFQEDISGGLVYERAIWQNERNSIRGHYEFKGYHTGGQIDAVTDEPLVILFNNSFGLKWIQKIDGKHLNNYFLEGHFLHFTDNSFTPQLAYEEGYGVYLNGQVSTSFGDFMLSYWYGDHFYSYKGGGLYQSVTRNFNSIRVEDVRQLLILRVLNEIKIGEGTNLVLRFEPHVDLQNKRFEFSHAFYFNVFKTLGLGKE